MTRFSPADWVIKQFRGVNRTARALGRDKSTIVKWRWPKEKRGRGGKVPSSAQMQILEKAKEHGLDITPTDLILGREIPNSISDGQKDQHSEGADSAAGVILP